jgi:hypothetical protein
VIDRDGGGDFRGVGADMRPSRRGLIRDREFNTMGNSTLTPAGDLFQSIGIPAKTVPRQT